MLATIIKKEILEAILSFRFLIATLLCLVLIPVGTYVNLKEYEKRFADYQESVRLYTERSEGNVHGSFHAEGYRPPSILSVFSVGLEYFLPNKIVTDRDGNIQTRNEQGIDNPQSLLFGKVDLLFNVSYVISLLALLFSFSAVTGEKEDGTLRLVVSNPVPRWQVLLGKLIGNYVVLLIPFILSIIISLILLSASGTIPILEADVFPSAIIILLVTLLYVLVIFEIGLFVSTIIHRSITSIVTLLLVWVVMVLSLPKISPMIAEIIHPVKSQQVLNIQKSMLRDNVQKEWNERLGGLWERIAPSYGVDANRTFTYGQTESERQLLAAYDSIKGGIDREYETRMASELNRLDQEDNNERRTQASIAMNLSRLSPASCYAYTVSEIAATGTLEAGKVKENATRFQAQVKDELYDKVIYKKYVSAGGRGYATTQQSAPGFDPSRIQTPQLRYQPTSITEALSAEWVDILLIVLFVVVFFALSHVAFLRYDVR